MQDSPPGLPDYLIAALESEWRALTGSKGSGALSPDELDRAARGLLKLQRGLTGERELIGQSYMESPDYLGAYLLYYWPASFLQAGRALERSGFSGTGRAPLRVLDIGSGPGPGCAACALSGAESIVAADPSERSLALARSLMAGRSSGFRTIRWKSEGPDALPTLEAGLGAGTARSFDLVLLSHSINEIFHDSPDRLSRRADFLVSLSALLSKTGVVLAVEPALLSTSRELIALRDELVGRGWTASAPCPYKGPCPAYAAGAGQTCHDAFAWRPPYFTQAIAERAGLDRPELKMAWFALKPPEADDSPAGAGADDSRDRGTSAVLVVSDPMLNKAGRTRYMVCGREGRFSLSAKLSELPPECADFARLKRGMSVRLSCPEARGQGGAGLRPGSALEILS